MLPITIGGDSSSGADIARTGPEARPDGEAALPGPTIHNTHPQPERLVKNKLTDLNNHLFAQLERLSEEGLTAEQIEQEVRRTDAIVDVSEQIVRNADLQLKAVTILANHGERYRPHLTMIEGAKE